MIVSSAFGQTIPVLQALALTESHMEIEKRKFSVIYFVIDSSMDQDEKYGFW